MNEPDPNSRFRHIRPGDADAYPILGSPASPRADLGPAGSLRQQLARHQALTPRPWWARAILPATFAAFGLVLVSIALVTFVSPWWFIPAVGLSLLGAVAYRWLRLTGHDSIVFDDAGSRLHRAIHNETKAAKVLGQLVGDGWHILPDRLLPDTGHRLPFVLVGPAGLVIVSIIPDSAPLHFVNADLFAGNHNLSSWVETRNWEVARAVDGLERVGAADVPVWPLALHNPVTELFKQKTPTRDLAVGDMLVITDIDQAADWVRDHASPLPREYVAMLAGNVQSAFLPAASKDEPRDS